VSCAFTTSAAASFLELAHLPGEARHCQGRRETLAETLVAHRIALQRGQCLQGRTRQGLPGQRQLGQHRLRRGIARCETGGRLVEGAGDRVAKRLIAAVQSLARPLLLCAQGTAARRERHLTKDGLCQGDGRRRRPGGFERFADQFHSGGLLAGGAPHAADLPQTARQGEIQARTLLLLRFETAGRLAPTQGQARRGHGVLEILTLGIAGLDDGIDQGLKVLVEVTQGGGDIAQDEHGHIGEQRLAEGFKQFRNLLEGLLHGGGKVKGATGAADARFGAKKRGGLRAQVRTQVDAAPQRHPGVIPLARDLRRGRPGVFKQTLAVGGTHHNEDEAHHHAEDEAHG
jgi:hypothetical protein